jgi:hypothetical protein
VQCRHCVVHGDCQHHPNEGKHIYLIYYPVLTEPDNIDSYSSHTIHQDISTPNPSPDIPTRPHPRFFTCRLPPLPSPLLIAEPCPETCSSLTFPTRETRSSPPPSPRLLRRYRPRLWWLSRSMGSMVPRLAKPLGLGSNVCR